MVKIVTLVENRCSNNLSLINEHGLSFYIEYLGKSYLFDCGQKGSFLTNAERLGIDLSSIDCVIISHNHYDHAGGYLEFLKNFPNIKKLYTGKDFFHTKIEVTGCGKYTILSSGVTNKILNENKINHSICEDNIKLTDKVYLVGNFINISHKSNIPDYYIKCNKFSFIKDSFNDEISLVLDDDKGLIVFVGCSHIGIKNILDTIKKTFKKNIFAIFGGVHLINSKKDEIISTLNYFENSNIQFLGLNHCTGEYAEEIIKKESSINLISLNTGDLVVI